ncbi:hypothetical protein [Nocardia sp. alder85J]|uniref:hypothetical protein n=1 Tax=Nocardia sp. alder85J TaxID=2862949 RepID=UPI00225A6253|nr:hypothetical protein [Nocardia sp. alder85J]MCX4097712.1 hypothetical protein [Nocardia sp. alder85J]
MIDVDLMVEAGVPRRWQPMLDAVAHLLIADHGLMNPSVVHRCRLGLGRRIPASGLRVGSDQSGEGGPRARIVATNRLRLGTCSTGFGHQRFESQAGRRAA